MQYILLAIIIYVVYRLAYKNDSSGSVKKKGVAAGGIASIGFFIFKFGFARFANLFSAAMFLLPILKPLFGEILGNNSGALNSKYISLNVNPETGQITGKILGGAFKGQNIADLSDDEIIELLRFLVAKDYDSVGLLNAWLEKNNPQIMTKPEFYSSVNLGGQKSTLEKNMTVKEAREILGVGDKATTDEIKLAHKKLISQLHPDKGGTHYLASKVNQAKDVLIRET